MKNNQVDRLGYGFLGGLAFIFLAMLFLNEAITCPLSEVIGDPDKYCIWIIDSYYFISFNSTLVVFIEFFTVGFALLYFISKRFT